MKKRISQNDYYMGMAEQAAMRCTCFRVKIGAIIVRDNQIIATGYVGAPRKTKDCYQHNFCLRDKLGIPHGHRYELCRSVHAEMNAIINAARAGVSLWGADMFIYGHREPEGTLIDAFPCFICKKMIINAGIKRVMSSTSNGIKIFAVAKWVREWQKKDIIDDRHQYGK